MADARQRQMPRGRHRAVIAIAALVLCGVSAASLWAQPPLPPRGLHPPRFGTAEPLPIEGVLSARIPAPASAGLAGRFYYLEDPGGELTFTEVRAPEFQDRFQLSRVDNLNFGFSDSALWLRLDIRWLERAGDWMLTFDYPLLDKIEIFDATSVGSDPILELGDHRPFGERVVPHRYFAVPMPVPRGGVAWRRLYIRIETESSLQVRPELVSARELLLISIRQEFVFGLAYGVMVLMAVYNLFLFFQLRDKTYLLYVGSTVFGLLFLMCLNGHGFRYLWPRWPMVANQANPVLASLWVVTTAGFAKLFLEPAPRARQVSTAVNVFMALGLASTTVSVIANYRTAMVLASGVALVNAFGLLICGVIVWVRGLRAARFFTLAWAGVGLGTINLAISRFGWMPDTPFTRHGALIGAVLEMVLLSLALSDKYRLMALEVEGYSKGLEAMVAERTQQLAEANANLQQLATTDALTGVFNRRHFEEILDSEVGRHRRFAIPLSLAMLDIDHFKAFNDRYGHPLGDECLRRVAEAVRGVARRPGDLVARFGGEEFAVLLPHTDRDGARRIGDEIRRAVSEVKLTSETGEPVGVAVSVGVSTRVPKPEDSGARLVAAADRALYVAKRGGRDRVAEAGRREDSAAS